MIKADINAPVGVFDSGLGGLTVVREIMRQLPSLCFSCSEIQASVASSLKAATISICSAVLAASSFPTQSGEATLIPR